MVFEKTLTDIVKGIRASKRDTALYISSCIAEIKLEINSTDPHTKTNALQKLTFLQMMGYNMSWASFATIEVMSSPRFAYKRIGYLAASQAFTQDTDVVLLTTNTLKKELRGAIGPGKTGTYEAGLAINCLSNIVTQDLARELLPDVTNLTSHPQPYLRKKAILCLLKLFVKYPQGLRLTFGKIQECLLQDSNASVVSCAVNVITELSDKNPKNYLVLAPSFFQFLTTSSNNWMLIKVVKLLGSLVGEEPRLARKLLEPLARIVKTTQAKSLLYEAVHTITLCLPYCRKPDGSMPASMPSIVSLCAETLKSFVEERDQNLKYLGLVGFSSLMNSYPKVLSAPDFRPLILSCLSDEDITIRTRTLDLLIGMATKKNVMELVTQLLRHVDMAVGSYKVDLVLEIVQICSSGKYALLSDFAWYIDVLVILAHTKGIDGPEVEESSSRGEKEKIGPLVSGQLVDVTLRVLPVRAYAVRRMIGILLKTSIENREARQESKGGGEDGVGAAASASDGHIMPDVLPSAAWIVGEYSSLIEEATSMESDTADGEGEDELFRYNSQSLGTFHAIIQALTHTDNVDSTLLSTQSIYIQAAMKVFAAASSAETCSDSELEACVSTLNAYLPVYMQSMDTEVQERAFTSFYLLSSLGIGSASISNGFASDSLPKLTSIRKEDDDDDDDSSSDEEGNASSVNPKTKSTSDDLLNLVMAPTTTAKTTTPTPAKTDLSHFDGNDTTQTNNSNTPTTTSIASKCRAVSATLQYVLIPEPMKPVSVKAQRKKRQSAPESIQTALEQPFNAQVFSNLLAGEKTQKGGSTATIESVSFTQQKPMRVVGSTAIGSIGGRKMEGFGSSDAHAGGMSGGDVGTTNGSFQNQNQGTVGMGGQETSTINDPFYLNSSGGQAPGTTSETPAVSNVSSRFGAIQLLDSGGDESEEDVGKKKKKSKKKKKKQSNKLSNADFALFNPTDNDHPNHKRTPMSGNDMKIYNSDDDDDDDDDLASPQPPHPMDKMKKSNARLKGFESLAMVDLTTPLGHDEVMPVNEHRVVPDRNVDTGRVTKEDRHAKSKEKKKKKSKKKEKKAKSKGGGTVDMPESTTGDLLDFGDLMNDTNGNGGSNEGISPSPVVNQGNAVNNAFDELLALDAPASVPLQNDGMLNDNNLSGLSEKPPSKSKSRKKAGTKLWHRGTIKASKNENGEGAGVDSSMLSLLFRTHVSKNDSTSCMITLKIINHTADKMFQNVHISFDNSNSPVNIGDAEPGTAVESKTKSGPFTANADGTSPEVRGTLHISNHSFTIKIPLPSNFTLAPISGLTQEKVLSELSNGEWSSYSSKVKLTDVNDNLKVKSFLSTFLKADEVEPEQSSDMNGMFASQSASGAKVFALLKIGKGTVKMDIKSTDKNLGKALSSDVKKIVI